MVKTEMVLETGADESNEGDSSDDEWKGGV